MSKTWKTGLLVVAYLFSINPIPAHGQSASQFADNEQRMIQAIDRCRLDQIRILAEDVYTLMVGIKGARYVDRAASFARCTAAIPVLAEAGARVDVPEGMPGGTIYKTWFDAGNLVGRRDISSEDKRALWQMLLETYGFPSYQIFEKSIALNVVSLMTAECDHGPALDEDLVATLQMMTRYSSAATVLSMAYEPANRSGRNPIDYAALFHCPKTLAFFNGLSARVEGGRLSGRSEFTKAVSKRSE